MPCPWGHVQAAPPGLQDRGGPRPVVASHQRHPLGVPLVSDPGEGTSHDLVTGGGLPASAGLRPDGRPPTDPGRGRGGQPGAWGPVPPQGGRTPLRRARVVGLRGRHPSNGSGCGHPPRDGPRDGGMAMDHRAGRPRGHVQGSRGNEAPRRCCSGESPSHWRRPSASSGINIPIGVSKATGPVLSRRLEAGRSTLRRLPHLSTYGRRERAISTLVTPLALHGVAVAPVTDPDLRGFETAVVAALWGSARVSRAKEVTFTVLSKGHRVSLVMHTQYERLLWLARFARRPGVTQVSAQSIWELRGRPPGTGLVGRALRTAVSLRWTPREGWWWMARLAARRCGRPPRSWRNRCCAVSWPGPCGRRPGWWAAA